MTASLRRGNLSLYLNQYGGLVLLLALYIVLTLTYSYAIPFSKGPDEYIHYQYILFIAKHRRLPTTIAEKQEAGARADWQPLYYIAAGMAAMPIALESPPELKVTWQPATRQLIDLVLPRATLVRTEDERPPYRGVYAVWQTGRWVSLALGAGTLVVTYFIGLALWPGQSALATGATALLVFIPRFLFTHAVLSDDTMLGFCLAFYLLLLVHLIRQMATSLQPPAIGDRRTLVSSVEPSVVGGRYWLLAGLGFTVGLAIVAKYTAIPVVVGSLIVGGLVARQQKWGWRDSLRYGAVFIGALTLIVGWWVGWVWWHFNQVNPLGLVMGLIRPLLPGATIDDNPTAAQLAAFLSGQALTSLDEVPGAGGTLLDWAGHTFATLWGVTVFGAEPAWPYPYHVILAGLALLCLVAGIGFWRVYRRAQSLDRLTWQALALNFLLFFPIPLLRFALSRRLNDAAQGRHLLLPAGPIIVALLMIGWLAWFRPQWRSRVALLTGGFILTWGVGHLIYLWLAYPPPLPVRTTLGPQVQVAHPTQIKFGNTLELTGYQTQLTNGGSTLQVDLLWQSLAQAWEDYRTEITLVDSRGQAQLRWLSHPANGRFPVRAWQPGDLVRDTLRIPVVNLPAGDYEVQLRLLGWSEPLSSDQGQILPLTTVTLDAVPSLSGIALWQQGHIVAEQSISHFASSASRRPLRVARFASPLPTYRYRSTIPVTVSEPAPISLVGPDGQEYSPSAEIGYLRAFVVNYDWPSGDYHLQVDGQDSGLSLWVENFPRNFTPPAMMYPVQANFANKIELLGYDLPARRAEAGSGIPLVLYWRGLTQMRESYIIFVQLLDANLQRRGGYDRLPRETYPTYLWVPGEVVDDGFAVPVEANAPNGVYTIRIGLYRLENGQAASLPLMQAGHPVDETSVVIGPIKIGGPPAGVVTKVFSPEHTLTVKLGETIALQGYDLRLKAQTLQLKLYWESLAQTETDYTVFVHLRDDAGKTVAQMDGPPLAGSYPTSLWDSGEIIPDTFTLNLPPGLERGTYRLVVGLYDPLTGARLAVPGTQDNSVVLIQIEIDDKDQTTLPTK